jgi:periplasmic protein TonB
VNTRQCTWIRRAALLALGALLLSALPLSLFANDLPRVPTAAAMGAAVHKPPPEYSNIARQLKIEGRVELDVIIDEKGGVEKVTAVSGNPVLTRLAEDALRKWKFTPFLVAGKASRVVAQLSFTFNL